MSRNMIAANEAAFRSIDDYCRLRGVVLSNAGAPRWIMSGRHDKEFLRHGKIEHQVSFSPRRKLVAITLRSTTYILAVGFEARDEYDDLPEVPISGGHVTFAISELLIAPIATISEIRQIVEYSDKVSDPEYNGHSPAGITTLYPPLLLLENVCKADPWNLFFRLTLDECRYTSSWIDNTLLEMLQMVAELDGNKIPYRVLCRSIFDVDPTSFYLAEYRCLEALFAYSSAKELSAALSLSTNWSTVATALEDTLGWHPHEDGSLTKLLSLASEADLREICTLIGHFPQSGDSVTGRRLGTSTGYGTGLFTTARPSTKSISGSLTGILYVPRWPR